MISNFRSKALRELFEQNRGRRLPPDLLMKIRNVLTALQDSKSLDELARPSLRLHPLKGDLKGFWAVTVRANWRIVFRFQDDAFHDVDFLDYH